MTLTAQISENQSENFSRLERTSFEKTLKWISQIQLFWFIPSNNRRAHTKQTSFNYEFNFSSRLTVTKTYSVRLLSPEIQRLTTWKRKTKIKTSKKKQQQRKYFQNTQNFIHHPMKNDNINAFDAADNSNKTTPIELYK